MNQAKVPRLLSAIAAILLFGTAFFHASGYSSLTRAIDASEFPQFYRQTLPGIWLFFSWHLIAIAAAAAWSAFRASANVRPLLVFSCIVIWVDTAIVYSVAGFFAGTFLVLIAAICLTIAAFQMGRS